MDGFATERFIKIQKDIPMKKKNAEYIFIYLKREGWSNQAIYGFSQNILRKVPLHILIMVLQRN